MKKEKKENRNNSTAQQVADSFTNKESKKADPMGSYTGNAKDRNSVPTQDADDL